MNNKPFLRSFSKRLLALSDEPLPSQVKRAAQRCLVDMLECVYSADVSDSRIASAYRAASPSQSGECRLWGTGKRARATDAVFYNAARGAVSYRNSLHRASGSHPVEIAAAAAVAAGEVSGARAPQTLRGIVSGIEAMTRVGMLLKVERLPPANRSTAMVAAFGAAAAAGCVWQLTEQQMTSALSFATHFFSGNNQWGIDGTGEDVFQAGWGARNVYEAARLARFGATGAANAFEGEAGLAKALGLELTDEVLQACLHGGYEILRMESKPIEGCLMVQTPAQIAERIGRGLTLGEIDRVIVHVCAQALQNPGCDNTRIETPIQSKMSIQYAVGAVLSGKQPSPTGFHPPLDAGMERWLKTIDLRESEAYSAAFPRSVPACIEVLLKNGEMLRRKQADFMPLGPEAVMERFRTACARIHDAGCAQRILDALAHLDGLSTGELISDW